MGLFDNFKEAGEIGRTYEWKLGIYPAIINVEDSYIYIKTGGREFQVFYKDIQKVENRTTGIIIKTITDKHQITPKKLRGGREKVAELYADIMDKMNNQKAPVTPNTNTGGASFCGNCGQALNGENFCPNCGTEVRKIN